MEVSLLIAGISLAFALYSGISNLKRNSKADTQKDTAAMTMVLVKLENITQGITEIKSELSVMRKDFQELHDKVIINEQSLKSAWRMIDTIENKIAGNNE
jgi:peptidoglycan hydrolase CwlO-like protein